MKGRLVLLAPALLFGLLLAALALLLLWTGTMTDPAGWG